MFNALTNEAVHYQKEHDLSSTPCNSKEIYCANCENCILFKQVDDQNPNVYYLRVRCLAEKWKKKNGGEKYYKYFTVARRKCESCDSYLPMGDAEEYLKELRKNLPINDEVYQFKKEEK